MNPEIVVAIVTSTTAAFGSIACALISSRNGKNAARAAKEAKDYRADREKLDKAKAGVLIATMEGVSVLLHQAKGERLNGNVETALSDLNEAKGELNDVRNEIMARI